MSKLNASLRHSFIGLASLIILGHAATAHAQVTAMQAIGSYDLNSGTLVGGNVHSYPPNTFVDVLNFPSNGSSNGGYHSYGSTSGNFGSRSSGAGIYDIASSFHITETVTNTSATVQNAIFNFHITPGMVMNTPTSLSGADFVKSGIRFDIKRDNTLIWDSQAELLTNTGGTTFTTSGNNLYTLVNTTNYSIAGGMYSVNLGALNPGQSLTLDYDLSTWASGNAMGGPAITVPGYTYTVPGQWVDCKDDRPNPNGNGGTLPCEPIFVPEHTVTVPDQVIAAGTPGGSHANAGDPFDIDFNGNPLFNGTSPLSKTPSFIRMVEVPEPSSYAMMVAGLAAACLVLQRRRTAL